MAALQSLQRIQAGRDARLAGLRCPGQVVSLLDRAWHGSYRIAYLLLCAWWRLRQPHCHGSLVALWHQGRLLLVRTSYRRVVQLPGGGMAAHETARAAAIRELWEELGLQLDPADLVQAWTGTHRYEHRNDTVTIWAVVCPTPPQPRIDNREIVAAFWCTPREALDWPLPPHLRDYLTQVIAQPG